MFDDISWTEGQVTGFSQWDKKRLMVRAIVPIPEKGKREAIPIRANLETATSLTAREERLAMINIFNLNPLTPASAVEEALSPFGRFTTELRESNQDNTMARVRNMFDGSKKIGMYLTASIPNYAWIDGFKVRIVFKGQLRHCTHCIGVGAEWPQSWSILVWPLCISHSNSLVSSLETIPIPVLATTLYYYVLKGIHKLLINITEIVDIYRNELSLT